MIKKERCNPDRSRAKRRGLLLPILALTFPINFAIAQTKTTITHHRVEQSDSSLQLAEAESAIEKHDYATAQSLLEKVTVTNPQNYQAWFDLGFVFHAIGRTDDSAAAYRKSVAANPAIFESNLNLGLTLAQSHNPEAEQFLRAATTLRPASHVEEGLERAWISLARVLEPAKPDEALEAYKKAETLQPSDPEPHLSAGLLLEKQNRIGDATDEYRTALDLDPSSTDTLARLVNLALRSHQLPIAEEDLRKIVTLNPADANSHTQLGRVLAAEGKQEGAIAEFEASIRSEPGNNDARQDLADLYLDAKKYDKAEPLCRSLLQSSPKNPDLHDDLGKILLNQHKFPDAQQEFLTAVELKPDFGGAYGDLAVAANENKNYALAIKAADARAKFLPEIPISYFLRATAYDHLRDKKNAILNYHQFLSVAGGKFPDQEWQSRERLKAIEPQR